MMSESEIRQWRDQEKARVDTIIDPCHLCKAKDTVHLLNQVLQEN